MTTQTHVGAAPDTVKMIIGGEQVDAADGQTFDVINPATGEVHRAGARWAGRRTSTARSRRRRRRSRGRGRRGPRRSAAGRCRSSSNLVKEHLEELAQLESRNVGKPITGARGEALAVSLVFEYYAGAANKVFGETIPVSKPGLDFTLREPIGVVGLIVPWNFPMNMASWKLGPALAAGNTCILKPASLHAADRHPPRRAGAGGRLPAGRRERRHRARAARPVPRWPRTRASARSPSPARRRPARRSCGWPPAT